MSILIADKLGVSFGAFDLFQNISVKIANDSKIGLLGPNGIGKTTLLLILAGINPPTTGTVQMARGRKLGYLRQEAMDAFADRSNTVYAEMQGVFADLLERQARLHELEMKMAAGDSSPELLETYGDQQVAFDHAGGYEMDTRIQQTLNGLGLAREMWTMPLKLLSGGQKTRALLARILLEKPDLLILDEPTNHLDIEAVEWLERTMREWEGAVLIVSHDRYFLDNTVNTIWEMGKTGIEVYAGNYSSYLFQREERIEYAMRVYEEEKARLANEADFIQRNWVRASTHARALGRLRRLTRELEIVDQYGILALRNGIKWSEMDLHVERRMEVIDAIRKVNAIQPPVHRTPKIKIRLRAEQISGTLVLRAKKVTIGFPGHELFRIDDMELRRGECAALIGPNGSGKTTFLKTLMGEVPELYGELQPGASLKIGYFAQVHDSLHAEYTVLEELQNCKEMDQEQARSHLAQYLFRGEDVFKQVSALSGGERARLALALLSLNGANFLLLDEPTNHLDIPAREALQEVLDAFTGTILLVSHDRFLIDKLATQIWELRDGELKIFKGNYRDFSLRSSTVSSMAQAHQTIRPVQMLVKGNDREARKRAQNLALLEERIHEQETQVQKLYADLQKASERGRYEQIHQLNNRVAEVQASLETLMSEWEKMAV